MLCMRAIARVWCHILLTACTLGVGRISSTAAAELVPGACNKHGLPSHKPAQPEVRKQQKT